MEMLVKLEKFKRNYRKKHKYFLYITPSLIIWFILTVYPKLQAYPMSFFEWNPLTGEKTFVGWYNYVVMFTRNLRPTLEDAGNTLCYVLYLLVIQSVLAMILALAMQKNTRNNRFFRAFFFLPMVFSTSMVSLTWAYMYDPNLGIINNFLAIFEPSKYPGFNFYFENWSEILCVVIVHIWANIGYTITILTSGLNTISEDLNEAAKIDGANSKQAFWKITFPLWLPTILRNMLLTITTGAVAHDYQVLLGNRTTVMDYDTWSTVLYKNLLGATDYGPVCAMGVVMSIVLGGITLIQYLTMRKVEKEIYG